MNNVAENYILEVRNLKKIYTGAAENLTVLCDLDFSVSAGQKAVITGESGCGKSTLLNIIGGLDNATSGSVRAGDYTVTELEEHALNRYRSQFVGLIFQFHYLLKDFTALENVFLPAYMNGAGKKNALERARSLLCDVGLEKRLHHVPSQLSGGERQRVAVARALINDPCLILADEPTGNLDPQNAALVSELLFTVTDTYKKTLILVTHDMDLAQSGDVHGRLENGKLEVI